MMLFVHRRVKSKFLMIWKFATPARKLHTTLHNEEKKVKLFFIQMHD